MSDFRLRSNANNIFVDREKEACRLREAILSARSLMIVGGGDIGKTALVRRVIAELPPSIRKRCLYVGGFKDLQDLLRRLILALFEPKNKELRGELRIAGKTQKNLEAWLKELSSSRLRGTLYRALQGKRYRVFFDHGPALTPSVARVVKELFWMRQTPVYLVTSGAAERETAKAGSYFYWGEKQILRVGPLPVRAARRLIDDCIQKYGLSGLDLEGFREEVLELSQLVPGSIVAMCRMAANPRYRLDSRPKTKLIHIDYLMRGCAGNVAPQRIGGRN